MIITKITCDRCKREINDGMTDIVVESLFVSLDAKYNACEECTTDIIKFITKTT
jgi:hypothetical protein